MRKYFIIVFIISNMLISVACSSNTGNIPSTEKSGAAVAKTIKVLSCTGMMDRMVNAISEKCKNDGVKIQFDSFDWNNYDGKQKIAMTSQGGDYDVILLPGNYIQIWAQSNSLIPLNDFMDKNNFKAEDIYDSVKKFTTRNNSFYGVPFVAESMVFYYRKDLYEKEGLKLPSSIDELYAAAKKLTKAGQYGIVIPAGPDEASCSFWSYFLWSYGGTYFDKSWMPKINSKEAVNAAQMYAKLLKECAPKGVSSWQNEETVSAFMAGNIASMVMWPAFYSTISDKQKSKIYDKVGVAILPKGPSGKAVPRFGTWGACIPVNCKNKKEAEVFIKYFCGNEGQSELIKTTSSAYKSINNDAGMTQNSSIIKASSGTLDNADERPAIPESQQYIPIVGNAINSIVLGKNAKQELENANKQLVEIMRNGGYF